jgi:hypothetical protein
MTKAVGRKSMSIGEGCTALAFVASATVAIFTCLSVCGR